MNPSLGNLVAWILGVYEFHRFLRGYSVTEADEHFVLNKHELKFSRTMDNLILRKFRVIRFVQEKFGPIYPQSPSSLSSSESITDRSSMNAS